MIITFRHHKSAHMRVPSGKDSEPPPPLNVFHNSGNDIAEHFNNIFLLRLAVDSCLTTEGQ